MFRCCGSSLTTFYKWLLSFPICYLKLGDFTGTIMVTESPGATKWRWRFLVECSFVRKGRHSGQVFGKAERDGIQLEQTKASLGLRKVITEHLLLIWPSFRLASRSGIGRFNQGV